MVVFNGTSSDLTKKAVRAIEQARVSLGFLYIFYEPTYKNGKQNYQ